MATTFDTLFPDTFASLDRGGRDEDRANRAVAGGRDKRWAWQTALSKHPNVARVSVTRLHQLDQVDTRYDRVLGDDFDSIICGVEQGSGVGKNTQASALATASMRGRVPRSKMIAQMAYAPLHRTAPPEPANCKTSRTDRARVEF